jgi:hypothetical protein
MNAAEEKPAILLVEDDLDFLITRKKYLQIT